MTTVSVALKYVLANVEQLERECASLREKLVNESCGRAAAELHRGDLEREVIKLRQQLRDAAARPAAGDSPN